VVGVAPYRAIYFFAYANSKNLFRNVIGTNEEPPLLHICSAFIAGFTAVSITNPIWFVKTRLQLDETRRGLSTFEVINKIFKEKGPLGFYKGISASYFGVAESAIYFVLYERLKKISINQITDQDGLTMLTYFSSAGFAKIFASCLCYPHGELYFLDKR
jgi:solute carrier family 25 protein 33/36